MKNQLLEDFGDSDSLPVPAPMRQTELPPAAPAPKVWRARAAARRPIDPPRPELPWIELAQGGIEIHLVPGDHETMHEPPQVAAMGEVLRARLRAAGS